MEQRSANGSFLEEFKATWGLGQLDLVDGTPSMAGIIFKVPSNTNLSRTL